MREASDYSKASGLESSKSGHSYLKDLPRLHPGAASIIHCVWCVHFRLTVIVELLIFISGALALILCDRVLIIRIANEYPAFCQ